MKFNLRKIGKLIAAIVLALLALALAPLANAGPAQFDLYAGTRPIQLTPVNTLVVYATPLLTNGPFDMFGYEGRVIVDVTSLTNAGGALTCGIEFSNDTTNWTAFKNYAFVNGAAATNLIPYTNYYYGGTNLVVSNAYLLPGNISNAVPNVWGYAGNYLVQSGGYAFTNTPATQTITRAGIYSFAFDVQSQPGRYMHIYYTGTGANTNDYVSAKLWGIRSSEVQ